LTLIPCLGTPYSGPRATLVIHAAPAWTVCCVMQHDCPITDICILYAPTCLVMYSGLMWDMSHCGLPESSMSSHCLSAQHADRLHGTEACSRRPTREADNPTAICEPIP
jgi:hypothetical protein